MPAPGNPRISVILPTYQRPDLLTACLRSLETQDADPSHFDVIAVDDASGAATVAVLEQTAHDMTNLRWVSQPENRGPAAARNRAIAMSTAPLLLFVDDDVVAAPDLVSTHLRLHETLGPKQGVVGLIEWLPALRVTPFMTWLDSTWLQFDFPRMTPGPQPDAPRCFYTCNLSLKRAHLESVGGFNESFPYPAYEDTELCIRLVEAGFELHYRPEALGWHARAITLDEFADRMRRVAISSRVLEKVRPDLAETFATADTGLARINHSDATHAMLRIAAKIAPRVFGQDLRASYYWGVIKRSYVEGLREADDGT